MIGSGIEKQEAFVFGLIAARDKCRDLGYSGSFTRKRTSGVRIECGAYRVSRVGVDRYK